ncbi:hypothetical protein K8B83_14845 [Shewanella inventionis]|uniref:hypothetical protein n=1 Tax=Shewanella inventionis TaxID=1738770 RepID=UPI001CBD7A09|nr:hypothetical protein [Shewanella inventionis]UAL42152.1 hypothetical protein K8B83_14845 [Shewanella inventionis]
MSDAADNAAKEAELHFAAALKVRRPVLPFLGFCHYCIEPLGPTSHFCDADCRYDYERLAINGKLGTGAKSLK